MSHIRIYEARVESRPLSIAKTARKTYGDVIDNTFLTIRSFVHLDS